MIFLSNYIDYCKCENLDRLVPVCLLLNHFQDPVCYYNTKDTFYLVITSPWDNFRVTQRAKPHQLVIYNFQHPWGLKSLKYNFQAQDGFYRLFITLKMNLLHYSKIQNTLENGLPLIKNGLISPKMSNIFRDKMLRPSDIITKVGKY